MTPSLPEEDGATSSAHLTPEEALAYWTPERRAAAVPREMLREPPPDDEESAPVEG